MKLQAVFWDYPEYQDKEYLIQCLTHNCDEKKKNWFLQRFLENGRVVDTFKFFSLELITKQLPKLRLSDYNLKKWNRLIEIYNTSKRK